MKATQSEANNDDKKKKENKLSENPKNFFRTVWDDLKDKTRTVKFWIELVAVAGGIFYAVVTYCMWRDSHKNFVIEERAWLSIDSMFPAPKENIPIESEVHITNTGKTPAKKIVSEFVVSIFKNTDAVKFEYSNQYRTGQVVGIMQPNGFVNTDVVKPVDQFHPVLLTKTDVDDLQNGRAYWAVYGRGQYDDIFGETHWFHFCNWISNYKGGTYNTIGCTQYSDTGDGKIEEK